MNRGKGREGKGTLVESKGITEGKGKGEERVETDVKGKGEGREGREEAKG